MASILVATEIAVGDPTAPIRYDAGAPLAALRLRLSLDDAVTPIAPPAPRAGADEEAKPRSTAAAAASDTWECPRGNGVVVVSKNDLNANPFCVVATTEGIELHYAAQVSFVTANTSSCVDLHSRSSTPGDFIAMFVVRAGHTIAGHRIYDGGRATCQVGIGFSYAVSTEQQTISNLVPANRAGLAKDRSILVPWTLLRIESTTTSIMVAVNVCGAELRCKDALLEFQIPIIIDQGTWAVDVHAAPLSRSATNGFLATPNPRLHDLGGDANISWDQHDEVWTSFAQDEGTVNASRALSQALSLSSLGLPSTSAPSGISQTLQTQLQSTFGFPRASSALEDKSMQSFFDSQPYVLSKLGTLAAGYAYEYSTEGADLLAVHGNQGPGQYSGAELLRLRLATPEPSPEPSPLPLPAELQPKGAQAPLPLQPPPPPGPFAESSSANDPRLQATLLHSYLGNNGTSAIVDALGLQWHAFASTGTRYGSYTSWSFDLFSDLQNDQEFSPTTKRRIATSQYAGESSTLTSATADSERFWQVRETIATQQDDQTYAPSIGSVTWLAPLSGTVGHVVASYASGPQAHYFALDLFGFRATNANGDFASRASWQGTIPLFNAPGWLISGGTETQVVTDRLAALQQGLLSGYAAAIAQVDSSGKSAVAPSGHNEQLSNVSFQSPLFNISRWEKLSLEFVVGYDAGSVTACNQSGGTTTVPLFSCAVEPTNHIVGGAVVSAGKIKFGLTDTPALSANVGPSVATHSLGTTGTLPGSLSAYVAFAGCPTITLGFANAAFPTGVPLPQQGSTLAIETDTPATAGSLRFDIGIGYYNERPLQSSNPSTSGAFISARLTATAPRPPRAVCSL